MESSCKQHFQVFVSESGIIRSTFIIFLCVFSSFLEHDRSMEKSSMNNEDKIVWVKYPFKSTKDIWLMIIILDTDNKKKKNRNSSCTCDDTTETCSQRKMTFRSTGSKACEHRLSYDDIHDFQSQWSGPCYPWPSETKATRALTVISLLSLSTLQWALEIHSLCPTGPDLFISELLSFSISSEEITTDSGLSLRTAIHNNFFGCDRIWSLDLYTY